MSGMRSARTLPAMIAALAVVAGCKEKDQAAGTWSDVGDPGFYLAGATVVVGADVLVNAYQDQDEVCNFAIAGDACYAICNPGGVSPLQVHKLDGANGSWSQLPAFDFILPPSQAGFHSATVLASGRVFWVGARDYDGTGSAIWDPVSGQWSDAAGLADVPGDHGTVLLGDGTVLLSGGHTVGSERTPGAPDPAFGLLARYDPATDRWIEPPTLPTRRGSPAFTALADGRVLFAGGELPDGASSAQVDIFDPGTGTWVAAAPLPAARARPRAILLSDGSVVVIGGRKVWRYAPDADVWSDGGDLLGYGGPVVALPDGRLFVQGDRAELYDPVGRSSRDLGGAQRTTAAQLAALPDGRVLVVGGCAEAQLFTPASH